jgi:hypothetical protein
MTAPNNAVPVTDAEKAAQMAAANNMARVDALPVMVQNLVRDAQTLGRIFDEQARRIAVRNIGLPPDLQEQPDFNQLKDLIDAQANATAAIVKLREEQREEMKFYAQRRNQRPTAKIRFGFVMPDAPKL